jgi:hypothetical protein
MDPDVLRELLARRPFRPFRIMITGGIWYEVRHAVMAAMGRRTIEIGLPIEDGRQQFVTISLIHVVCVATVGPAPED